MKTVKERQEEFLLETMLFYNSENRCISHSGCVYSYDGKNCAIGRKLPKDYIIKLLEEDMNSDTDVRRLFEEFGTPEYFKFMHPVFITNVQSLHDRSENWDDNGLTRLGLHHVKYICKEHDIDYTILKKKYDDSRIAKEKV